LGTDALVFREFTMFVTTKRASAWLDRAADGTKLDDTAVPSRSHRPASTAVVRYAFRALETPAGRCIALKLVQPADGTPRPPRFLVLFESRYERTPRPRWLPLERVLGEAEAEQWIKDDFRR
jgi:hypothetical protein